MVLRPSAAELGGRAEESAAPQTTSIVALTSIRGVAAIWVMLFHGSYFVDMALGTDIRQTPLVRHGWLGVDFFFILSGFILAYVYYDKFDRVSWSSYRNFMTLRVFRVYPLHLFVLALFVIPVLFLDGFREMHGEAWYAWDAFVRSVFLVQSWFHYGAAIWNIPAWSLSLEILSYLMLPFMLVVIRRFVGAGLAALGCVAVLAGFAAAQYVLQMEGGGYYLLRALVEFPAGVLLFVAARSLKTSQLVPVIRLVAYAAVVALIGTAVMIDRAELVALLAFALIVLLAYYPLPEVKLLLENRVALFLGEISFSLYMVHWLVFELGTWLQDTYGLRDLPGWQHQLFCLGVIASIVGLSVLTWRYVEVPARQVGRRIVKRGT